MITPELREVLSAAVAYGKARSHAYLCLEHLLIALLEREEISRFLTQIGGDVAVLKANLSEYLDTHVEKYTAEELKAMPDLEPERTPTTMAVFERAIYHSRYTKGEEADPLALLVAITEVKQSHAYAFLRQQGIRRLDILRTVAEGDEPHTRNRQKAADESTENQNTPVLAKYAEDLTDLAAKNRFDPLIGRDLELERLILILSRKTKNNALILGDPGVGKTALCQGLAVRIAEAKVPAALKNTKLFSVNIASLLAGTKYRGDFEQRLKKIVKELKTFPSAILFIDEIQSIVGAGSTGNGTLDAAGILKPLLSGGSLRCIGTCTFEDYKKTIEKDRALNRRFATIELKEPDHASAIKILKGLQPGFETHHQVKYSDLAIEAAVKLAARHITDRLLPDKAIDVIDEAGAFAAIGGLTDKRIDEAEIASAIGRIARVPVESVNQEERGSLKELDNRLKARVFGQDHAIEAVSKAIKRSRAGLSAAGRPVGCFLFTGPTGVGKTELAKALAETLNMPFHRFDMSEYMEKHSVAKFIGAPPGYVGHEEGGALTDIIRKKPHAVLLLDEIEKAHSDVFNILLQVMDDARLTDSQGRTADFRNVILIMTTNAGSDKSLSMGFSGPLSQGSNSTELKRLFRPEFRNRLDEIVTFAPLPFAVQEAVVQKAIAALQAQLKERGVILTVSAEAVGYLARTGYNPELGARPINRLVQRELRDPLTDKILFGELKNGGTIEVVFVNDKLDMKTNSQSSPARRSRRKQLVRGATMVEYAMLLSLLFLALIVFKKLLYDSASRGYQTTRSTQPFDLTKPEPFVAPPP